MQRYQIFEYGREMAAFSNFFVNLSGYLVEEIPTGSAPAHDALAVVGSEKVAKRWRPSSDLFYTGNRRKFAIFETSDFKKLYGGYCPRIIGGVVVVPVRDSEEARQIALNRNAWLIGIVDGSLSLSAFLSKYNK